MKIIEKYINSKTGNLNTCEDSIVVTDDFVAVMDGATSKSEKLWDGKTSGKIVTDLLSDVIEKLDKDCSASIAMFKLDSVIADWYKDQGLYEFMKENPIERPTASVIIYSRQLRQIWILSDCQAMIDDSLITNPEAIDKLIENLRAFCLEFEILKGKTVEDLMIHDTGRDAVLPFINKGIFFQNIKGDNEFIVNCLDGFFENEKSIRKIDLPSSTKQIVLASDGYPFLKRTLRESEEELQKVLKEDPLCFRRYRSTKGLKQGNISFDDRSYIRIEID